jgi:hypothetical protein
MAFKKGNPIAGVECLILAIPSSTFVPGNSPPSPGFAPCETLIWQLAARNNDESAYWVFAKHANEQGTRNSTSI